MISWGRGAGHFTDLFSGGVTEADEMSWYYSGIRVYYCRDAFYVSAHQDSDAASARSPFSFIVSIKTSLMREQASSTFRFAML